MRGAPTTPRTAATSSPWSPRCIGGAAGRRTRQSAARARRETLMSKRTRLLLWLCAALPAAGAQAQLFRDTPRGEAVERQLPGEVTFTPWVRDPAQLSANGGDRIELRQIPQEQLETVKLANVVPAV